MRVFVTGATGFIGSALVPELIRHGHQVLGMARSEEGAKALAAAGAEAHRGDLHDVESLRKGAAACDAVIHLAFVHDFSKMQENCELDRRAIETLGDALAGSQRPMLVTSGTAIANTVAGRAASEEQEADPTHPFPRVMSELAAEKARGKGVRVGIVRLPQVHDPVKQGLITYAVELAKQKGVSAYVGEGKNRWPAVHVSDAARVYRLALENLEDGARYHPVAEEGVTAREIAEAIARRMKIPAVSLKPEEAPAHFGWLAMFIARDLPASSALTRKRLGWEPAGPSLIADLDQLKF